MTWRRAWSALKKGGSDESGGGPETAASGGDPRRTDQPGQRAGAGQAHAALGARSRADPLRQCCAGRGGAQQRDRGGAVGCVATDARRPADRWHALGTGADVSERVHTSAHEPASVSGAVLQPPGLSTHEQRDGTEHSWPQNAVSPREWLQELEQLSLALRALSCLRRLVGAGCRPSATTGTTRRSAGSRSLVRIPTANQSRSQRAAQALSLSPQTSAIPHFTGGALGCRYFDVTFALTVFKEESYPLLIL